jgi:Fe-S cluster assembly scaffold protein SufB
MAEKKLDSLKLNMLREVADLEGIPAGAYSIRVDGDTFDKKSSENIIIEKKSDKPGIDIYIKAAGKRESVHIPVILAESGLKEVVYNDFHIEDGADVLIIAGCGIHNCGVQDSEHSGIHSFFVGKNAKVKYVEKHYGEGDGNGKNVMNPHTVVELDEGAYMEMETTQIKGVDSTKRKTEAVLHDKSTLIVHEKIMTHGEQYAETEFVVDLKGEDCGTHVVSRSVAKDNSRQLFVSDVVGNAKCSGHTECDAIIMDNASVVAVPKIVANNTEASLIHEAAIGKIAGEQLIKLMTLGLDEKQAEEEIINGFLK